MMYIKSKIHVLAEDEDIIPYNLQFHLAVSENYRLVKVCRIITVIQNEINIICNISK